MGDMGFGELLLIGIVLVVIFGPKKLPELGASIGKAIKDFRHTLREPDLTERPEGEQPAASSQGSLQQHADSSESVASKARDH